MRAKIAVAALVIVGLLLVLVAPQAVIAKTRVVEVFIPNCG